MSWGNPDFSEMYLYTVQSHTNPMAGPYLKLKVGVEGTVLPVAEGDWGFVS